MGKTKAARKAKLSDNKLLVKMKGSERVSKRPSKKAEKDPNRPKRPPIAFFVFMEEFRKTFKDENPKNKSAPIVGKAGRDKWKTMSEAEKAPFIAKAEKRKVEYNKTMAAGESTTANEKEEEVSDKSKPEVDEESGKDDDEDDDE